MVETQSPISENLARQLLGQKRPGDVDVIENITVAPLEERLHAAHRLFQLKRIADLGGNTSMSLFMEVTALLLITSPEGRERILSQLKEV